MSAYTFTFALIPGRFDAPRGPLRDWLAENQPYVAGHTEVNTSARANEIHGPPNQFRGLQWDPIPPGHTRGNCGVSWLPSAGPMRIFDKSFKTTNLTYQRVGGATVEMWAPIVVIWFPNGRKVLFSTIHLPSSVEDKTGWKNTQRTRVHRAAVRGWRRECRRVAKKHNAERVLSGDFNVNYRRRVFSDWFGRTFPRLRGADHARTGQLRPTHGRRVIDRVIYSVGLRALHQEVMPAIEGYDHRPQMVTFTWDTSPRWTARFRKIGRRR